MVSFCEFIYARLSKNVDLLREKTGILIRGTSTRLTSLSLSFLCHSEGDYIHDDTMGDSTTQDNSLVVGQAGAGINDSHDQTVAAGADSQRDQGDTQVEASLNAPDISTKAGQESSHAENSANVADSSVNANASSKEQCPHEVKDNANSTSVVNADSGAQEKASEAEHLPEPPASPTSNTAFSGTSSGSTNNPDLPPKPLAASRLPSPNRVSISYAGGARRLLIDADIVDKLKVFRAEGRIEISMAIERLAEGFKGILVKTIPILSTFSY